MASERISNRQQIENPTTLLVNWPASKMTVAGFTRAAFNYVYAQDREFFLRTAGRGTLTEGLLYDIGHYGRGMQDFPFEMPVTVPQPKEEAVAWDPDQPNLLATMELPQLYDQITDQVEKYIVETYRRQSGRFAPRADAYQGEIDVLRELADYSTGRLVTVTFSRWDKLHKIEKMESEGYSYEDPF